MSTPPKLGVQAPCGLLIVIASLAFLTLAFSTPAQVLGPYVPPSNAITPEAKPESQPPMRLAERTPIEKPLVLRPASEGARNQLDALEAWNRAGKRPTRIGFSRPLPEPITATFGSSSVRAESAAEVEPHAVRAATGAGVVVWATKVTVIGAYGIRLHLVDVHLPAGTRFWTYSPNGRAIGFGLELLSPLEDIWTPTVFGETVLLEVELPSAGSSTGFSILELSQLVLPGEVTTFSTQGTQDTSCLIDATCATSSDFDQIANLRSAVAFLIIAHEGTMVDCTGTLLNDTATSGIPYLLTANHCISSQSEASSLEAYWDYRTSFCGGSPPSLSTLPRASSGILLANSSNNDFSFLRLSSGSATSGRARMGWDARPSSVEPGTPLYRISFAASSPQRFSVSRVENVGLTTCGSFFIPSSRNVGGDFHGSSGAAAVLWGGYVVGQLRGVCQGPDDACDNSTIRRDGAFSQTYPSVAQWLGGVTEPVAFAIPVVGSTPGSFGSFFRTGVQVLNSGGAAVSGRFIYHPAGLSGTSTDPGLDFSIPRGATISYADLVQTMGQTGLGSLDVVIRTTNGRIAVVTRVFNDAGSSGSSGFTEEAVGVCSTACPANSSRLGRLAGTGYLIAPADPSRFRFNIGVRTLETGATLNFGVYDASGNLVQSVTKAYGPNYFIQQPAEAFLGVPLMANYSVVVGPNSGYAIVYGATIDNTTNDSSIQSTGVITPLF